MPWHYIQTKSRSTHELYFQILNPSGAPGADEAFKSEPLALYLRTKLIAVVSKAFQVLSDDNLRAAFDANPHSDPTQRGGGMPSRSPGFAHPGFSSAGGFGGQDIDPAELFNMFFGGGGMNNGFGGANGMSQMLSFTPFQPPLSGLATVAVF